MLLLLLLLHGLVTVFVGSAVEFGVKRRGLGDVEAAWRGMIWAVF